MTSKRLSLWLCRSLLAAAILVSPTYITAQEDAGMDAEPDPMPDPMPDAMPDAEPDPMPDPDPDPEPEPQPDPEPAPQPDPMPDPMPEPEPNPEPIPNPEPDVPPLDGGLTGDYFTGRNFDDLVLTRIDAVIDFDWSEQAPAAEVPRENITVRWTGQITPRYTEQYNFHTFTDDGARLWINGQMLINAWVDQGRTEHIGQIALRAGEPVDIKMEYYQGSGGASATLMWSSASQVMEAILNDSTEPESPALSERPTVGVFITDPTATEGSPDTARVTVFRWGSLEAELTVNIAMGGEAENGVDYQPIEETLTIAAGRSTADIVISSINDDDREDTETIEITINDGDGYGVGEQNIAPLVLDDDEIPPPQPTYAITGIVAYNGEPVNIVVGAWEDEDLGTLASRRILVEPGQYAVSNLDAGTYYVAAFLDDNANGELDDGERISKRTVDGAFAPVTIPPDVFMIDLSFLPPPPPEKTDDCACTVTDPARSSPWWLAVLGLAVVWQRRRSRRR